MAAKAKLSGNSLGNFSAFVSARFRANDWMWGRMDAAKGLVDIMLRDEYLAESPAAKVEAFVKKPFLSVVGDDVLKASGEKVCCELWRTMAATVAAFEKSRDPTLLAQVRQLVTARWQLEIFLAEIREMYGQKLQPESKNRPFPALAELTGDDETDLKAAQSNVQRVMDDYMKSPRQVSALWGQRQTTALGVKVARNAANAIVPDGGFLNFMKRFAVAAPLLIATAAVLSRGAFVVGSAILVNTLLVPRSIEVAAFVAWSGGLLLSGLLFATFVRRKGHPWRVWSTAVITTGAYAFGAATLHQEKWRFSAPAWFDEAEWPLQGVPADTVRAMIAVGVLVALASALLWVWAKLEWRIPVSLAAGAVIALWVPMGAWNQPDHLPPAGRVLSFFGSMWIPAFILLLATTVVTVAARPENRKAKHLEQ